MERKKQLVWRYGFALIIIIAGILLEHFNIGGEFGGFGSVGYWLLYVGIIMLAVATFQLLLGKKRIVDERSQFIGMKAARITYVFIILTLFVTMIMDGIKPITIPYSRFMATLICGITLVYFVSYKIMEEHN